MNKLQEYRKNNGLCINCGERAVPGKTRCIGCLQYECAMAKMRYEQNREQRLAYSKEYNSRPEIKDKYGPKKSEYNRRYREKNPQPKLFWKERWFLWDGEWVRLGELAKRYGVNYNTLYDRIYKQRLGLKEAVLFARRRNDAKNGE